MCHHGLGTTTNNCRGNFRRRITEACLVQKKTYNMTTKQGANIKTEKVAVSTLLHAGVWQQTSLLGDGATSVDRTRALAENASTCKQAVSQDMRCLLLVECVLSCYLFGAQKKLAKTFHIELRSIRILVAFSPTMNIEYISDSLNCDHPMLRHP